MALATRVIPCLDIKDGKVVKGIKFQDLQEMGDPVDLATRYFLGGADEITYLDVSASLEGRNAILDLVSKTADTIFIPLTVGGGIKTIADVSSYLKAGADKVSVGSAAMTSPNLLDEVSESFGDQVLVVSLDIKRDKSVKSGFTVTTHGGLRETGIDAFGWIEENQKRGIGELLLNSMDFDGTRNGFDVYLISQVRSITSLPIIASGGAGNAVHFAPAVEAGANAVLAASIFHSGQVSIQEVKNELRDSGMVVR